MSSTERRDAILRAASRLFEHYGHGKTTMADVAREAHVGVGTVYLEFDSKEAIVQELSRSAHAGVLEAMRAAIVDDDPARCLKAVLMARTARFLELRDKGQHACELLHCRTEGVRTAHKRFREEERALLAEILERGRELGVFADVDAMRTAAIVQRAFASLSPPWIFSGTGDMLAIASEMCELVLVGLMARPNRASKARRHPQRPLEDARARKASRRRLDS
jgi:AcrR family transcriptional regulator